MRAIHCPIDTALNFTQARKLVRDLRPGCLALPECYTRPPKATPSRVELTVETDVPKHSFTRYETIEIPLKPRFESIRLDPELAAALTPTEVRPGVAVATITGALTVKNNRYELHQVDDRPVKIPKKRNARSTSSTLSSSSMTVSPFPLKTRRPSEHLAGAVDVARFLRELKKVGLGDGARVEQDPGESMASIHLVTID